MQRPTNTRDNVHEFIVRLKQEIDASPGSFLSETKDLLASDYELMGRFIQIYCCADLNARRVIDALRHAAFGPSARNGSVLQDSQVFPKLNEVAAMLFESDLREGLAKAARNVELHRVHRHNFAHWAARRVSGHEVFVLFTKNAKEAERRDRIAQSPDEIKYALVPIGGFSEELPNLAGHAEYL